MTHAYETPEQDRRRQPREAPPSDPLARILPAAADAERALLGSMMFDATIIDDVRTTLRGATDFYTLSNQAVYAAIVALYEKDRRCDLVTLRDQMERCGQLDDVGGVEYLIEIQESVPSAASGIHYARIVRDKAKLRDIVDVAGRIMTDAFSASDDPEAQLTRAEGEIFKLLDDGRSNRTSIITVGAMLQQHYDYITSGAVGNAVPTGFTQLDSLLGGGLHRGEYIILAARPSVGKTSLAMDISELVAVHEKHVLFFSLEMSRSMLSDRLLAKHTEGVSSAHIRSKTHLDPGDYAKIATTIGRLSDMRLHIDESPTLTVPDLRSRARRAAVHGKCDLVVIDYLQLIDMTGQPGRNRENDVSEASRGLKAMARELNVPVLVLSQLNRKPEDRAGGRPKKSDLRDSGCLTGDTLITMAETGERVPIADLTGKNGFKVWARDGNKTIAARCTNAFTTGIQPVYRMETTAGKAIRATANHRFMTPDGWLRLDQLSPGDTVACYTEIPCPLSPQSKSTDELLFLGHMIGNGCILKNHSAQYTTGQRDLAEHIASCATRLFGREISPVITFDNPKSQAGWYQVFFRSQRKHARGTRSIVSEWAEDNGLFDKRAHQKKIPDWVFRLDRSRAAMVLSGLWETDGTVVARRAGNNHHVKCCYSTTSRLLAEQIQYLLARIGVISSITVANKAGYKPSYMVDIRGGRTESGKMLSQMSFIGKYGLGRLKSAIETIARITGTSGNTLKPCNGVLYERIAAIEPAGPEQVYDLTVPCLENMEANLFVAHNSLEQDSDVILLLHRDDVHKKSDPNYEPTGDAILDIAKQRNGPTLDLKLKFDPERTTFREAMYP